MFSPRWATRRVANILNGPTQCLGVCAPSVSQTRADVCFGFIRVADEPRRVVGHVWRPPKPDVASTNESLVDRGRWRTAREAAYDYRLIDLSRCRGADSCSLQNCWSIQAGAALASAGVSQQAFEHETGVWVDGVMPAHVTPSREIPIDGAGSGDQVH
jgi:hypothetical protein